MTAFDSQLEISSYHLYEYNRFNHLSISLLVYKLDLYIDLVLWLVVSYSFGLTPRLEVSFICQIL